MPLLHGHSEAHEEECDKALSLSPRHKKAMHKLIAFQLKQDRVRKLSEVQQLISHNGYQPLVMSPREKAHKKPKSNLSKFAMLRRA